MFVWLVIYIFLKSVGESPNAVGSSTLFTAPDSFDDEYHRGVSTSARQLLDFTTGATDEEEHDEHHHHQQQHQQQHQTFLVNFPDNLSPIHASPAQQNSALNAEPTAVVEENWADFSAISMKDHENNSNETNSNNNNNNNSELHTDHTDIDQANKSVTAPSMTCDSTLSSTTQHTQTQGQADTTFDDFDVQFPTAQ